MQDFFSELERTAKAIPHATAVVLTRGSIDYASLVAALENIANHAHAAGLRAGQLVHVESNDDNLRLLMFLGLMRAGLTVAMLRAVGTAFAANGVLPDAVVTDRANLSPLAAKASRAIRFSREWLRPGAGRARPAGDREDFSLIFTSSGSTGNPKLIVKSADNVAYIIERSLELPVYGGRNAYMTLAPEITSSFVDYLVVLMTGGYIIRHATSSTAEIIDRLAVYRPTHVRLVPLSLVEILKNFNPAPGRFDKIEHIRLTGSYCSRETRAKAIELFANTVFTTYGSVELAKIAWGDFADIGATEGSVGFLDAGMVMEAVDDEDRPLPAGTEGRIRVKPPARAVTHYLSGEGLTEVLRAGYYYTGDLGCVGPTGEVVITGRESTVINFGGNKLNPEVVETTLRGLPGLEDIAVAPFAAEHGFEAICAVMVSDHPPTLEALNARLTERGATYSIAALTVVSKIPRTLTGKVDRKALRKMAEDAGRAAGS